MEITEKEHSCWEDFLSFLSHLDEKLKAKKKEKQSTHLSRVLLRGQSKSAWDPETTLERYTEDHHTTTTRSIRTWSAITRGTTVYTEANARGSVS
jgi:hypothetical protein